MIAKKYGYESNHNGRIDFNSSIYVELIALFYL